MHFKLVSVLLFLFSMIIVSQNNHYAQQKDSKLVQLSGVVVSSDSLNEMPYVQVYNKSVNRGTIGDIYGFFSLVVQSGDTLMFRYFGHKPSSYIVPDTLTQDRYSIIHMMDMDTFQLNEVIIYPWPSKEAFAQAFVEMNPYDDALLRAQKQLSGQSLEALAGKLGPDASIAYGTTIMQSQTKLYTIGQSPVNNLLNPVSWASFLSKWRNGELKRM
jgi:hypothetical protein